MISAPPSPTDARAFATLAADPNAPGVGAAVRERLTAMGLCERGPRFEACARARRFALLGLLTVLGCGGDPFAYGAPIAAADGTPVDPPHDEAAAPAMPDGGEPDAGEVLDAAADRDAAEVLDVGARDAAADRDVEVLDAGDAQAREASAPDAAPPPALCCLGASASPSCSAGAGFSCYPAGAICSETCQATGDGGQTCTTSCPGTASGCADSAPGEACIFATPGNTFPGVVGPCA